MGAVSRNVYNVQLMTMADYNNKRQIKKLLVNYYNLEELAALGDSVAASIFIDLKTALASGYLTEYQRWCVTEVLLNRRTYKDVAGERSVSDSSIYESVDIGIYKIQKSLRDGRLYEQKRLGGDGGELSEGE